MNTNTESKSTKAKILFTSGLLIGIIPFLFIVYLLLGPLVRVIQKDFTAEKMYIISETLKIRSDKEKNSYAIGKYEYGTEVKVYKIFDNDWAEVSVGDKKGFMSTEYLVSRENFYLIDGVFGNELAQKNISQTIFKKAISTYLSENNYISYIPEDIKEELYGKDVEKEAWQIFAEKGYPRYNAFCYGDFNGNKKPDVAFIIKNLKTEKTKLIVLETNTTTPEKYGNLLYSKDLSENWFFIKSAKKGYKYKLNDIEEKERIILDGILIGTNRNPKFEDQERLLIYDGKKFDMYNQK
ncbi:MAG: SH3 domain-containing protein [Bacteroidota bacterium]|nr:SH3 domain-containing protein [Bacteroidota bacterium]